MIAAKRHTGRLLRLGLVLVVPVAYLLQVFPHVHHLHEPHHQETAHEDHADLGHHFHGHDHNHHHSAADDLEQSGNHSDHSNHSSHDHCLNDHLDTHFAKNARLGSNPDRLLDGEVRDTYRDVVQLTARQPVPPPDRSPPHLELSPACGPRSPPFSA